MKLKKLVSALVSGAMILGTMAIPAFAAEPLEEPVADEALETSGDVELFSAEDSWIDNADTTWYIEKDENDNKITEFTLTTAAQLAGLAQLVINGNNFSGKTIKLGDNIDLAGKNWTPIGGDSKAFNGTFDGNNYSVNNMTAKNAYAYGNGFFHSLIGPATVKNVSFNNAKVYRTFSYSGNVYGIVSGYAYGNVTFENIHVADSWVRGYGKVGAILGMAADWGGITTVKNCTVNNVYVYGVYNCATFIGTSLNSVDMNGCSYSNVSWVPYWAEKYYPIETTVANSGEIVNGLFWKCDIWYYAAWSDLYNVYKGSVAFSDVSDLDWSQESDADGWCVNNYASIGDTQYTCLQEAIDAAVDGDTVTLRRNYKNAVVNADKNITFKTAEYIMPNVTTPDSKYVKKINATTYSVLDSESTVVDNAKTTGAEVTLDNLKNNAAVDHMPDATYKVVVETAPKADADAVNRAIEDSKATPTPDTNTSKAMFDISVVKTDSNGVETVLKNVTQQQVTLTLGETPSDPEAVRVYHVVANGVTEIQRGAPNYLTVDGNTVTFIAPSFSTYAVTYTATPIAEVNIAKNVGVAFERVGDTSEYNIILKALDSKTINRFMSADLTFDMNVTSGAVGYTVNPAASVNLIDKGDGRYEFNLDGLTSSGATGTEVTIGTVTFEGNGTVKFGVKTEGVTTNIVNTAKAANNIVDNYTTAGNGVDTGRLELNNAAANGVINATFTAPTKDLTVNVKFNNAITDNKKAYQDMKAVISGGDLPGDITVNFGTDEKALVGDTYTFTQALTQNVAYTVTVEGAGYRTARHTVTMTADKTLNFWNNVLDANNKQVIEVGARDEDKVTKNFLAGDIVKDNNINIYDLSAVVSYFGENNLVTAHPEYVRYDLNRDGKIDSKDVAYVLVSWGE